MSSKSPLSLFHPPVRAWFDAVFPAPTRPQQLGWPAIARGESTLTLAPTGTGKTLAAFLWCINRLMFVPVPPRHQRCRVLYISPIKALAVDIFLHLLPHIDIERALLRGRYMVAAAHIEGAGIPTDTEALTRLGENWDGVRLNLIQRVNADYGGIFDGLTLKGDTWGRSTQDYPFSRSR